MQILTPEAAQAEILNKDFISSETVLPLPSFDQNLQHLLQQAFWWWSIQSLPCIRASKDDFRYSTTRKFVVEDVVNSGQKMAEEALFLVKWNLYLWSQLVLPLLSAFALKCAEILFNWVSFSRNVRDPDLFQSQKCGFTQPKVKFLAYLHANSDPRGSTSWDPK